MSMQALSTLTATDTAALTSHRSIVQAPGDSYSADELLMDYPTLNTLI